MIDLSIDISFLSKYYNVETLSTYAAIQTKREDEDTGNLTIITEDGSISVNQDLLQKLLEQPEKLAKVLQLEDPNNRYLIIQQFNEEDLDNLLPFLTSEQLAVGLQFFTPEGIEEHLKELPTEMFLPLLLEKFSMADVAKYMQENEMDNFFKNTKLDQKDVFEYFEHLDYEEFQPLMMRQFGYDFKDKTSKEYMEHIKGLDNKEYSSFLQNMNRNEKMNTLAGLCKINPDYYMEFENSVLVRPMMNELSKGEIIQTMTMLDPEFLAPMVEQLPPKYVQVIATQIDPKVFADILSSEFTDVIIDMLKG